MLIPEENKYIFFLRGSKNKEKQKQPTLVAVQWTNSSLDDKHLISLCELYINRANTDIRNRTLS